MDSNTSAFVDLSGEEDFPPIEVHPLEILNTLTALISAIASIFIIYVILKNVLLRTRSNFYLINWCICNLGVMLLVPVSLNLSGIGNDLSYEDTCVWEESLYGLLFGTALFALIVLLDWCFLTHVCNSSAFAFRQRHIFIISISWLLLISISIASVSFCIASTSAPLALICYSVGYLILSVALIVAHFLRCIRNKALERKQGSSASLIIVTSYFFFWLPRILLYGQFYFGFWISSTFEHLIYFLAYSQAWFMLILLYFFDQLFRRHVLNIFGCDRTDEGEENVNKEQNAVLL